MGRKARAAFEDWRAARRMVLERDGHTCQRCGERERRALHVHHRLPRSAGGGNDPGLLVTVCQDCHAHIHEHPAESYAAGWLVRRS